MPIYQFWCDNCIVPYEITMSLADKELFDRGKLPKEDKKLLKCPECGQDMDYLIAPPKTIKIR